MVILTYIFKVKWKDIFVACLDAIIMIKIWLQLVQENPKNKHNITVTFINDEDNPTNYDLIAHYLLKTWLKLKKISCIVPEIFDVFSFFPSNKLYTSKMKTKLCGNPYLLAHFFLERNYPSHNL